MRAMQRGLERAGFRTLNLDYQSRRKPLEDLARDIHAPIEAFAAEVGGPVHFVTHSMGGLLVRTYLAQRRPPALGRVVMLAPPNGGSEVADLLHRRRVYRKVFGPSGQQLTTHHWSSRPVRIDPPDYEVGIVAGNRSVNVLLSAFVLPGPNDGKVTVRSTMLPGMTDHVTVASPHPWVMRNAAAIGFTVGFLRHGRFGANEV